MPNKSTGRHYIQLTNTLRRDEFRAFMEYHQTVNPTGLPQDTWRELAFAGLASIAGDVLAIEARKSAYKRAMYWLRQRMAKLVREMGEQMETELPDFDNHRALDAERRAVAGESNPFDDE